MDARTEPGLDPRLEALLEHAEWARGLAGRLVADAARADDVVQSALAAAAKSPPRDATNLRGWLGQVVRNAARTVGREEGRRDHRERAAARPEAIEGADELVARAEMSRDLAQHVLALDEIYRDVVLLRWYEGLAPREIAKRLGVPVATVNTRLARAHGELRTRLDRAYGDRASWCAAFAPLAVMPKPALPLGAVAALSLACVVVVAVGAAWLRYRDDVSVVYQDASGQFVGLEGAEARAFMETATRAQAGANAPVDSPRKVDRHSIDPTASASAAAFAGGSSVHVEGRVVGFDGRGIAGLALRGRDPSLPRIENGWLHIGNTAQTITEKEPWEWKNIPEALEHTLRHFGNPPFLREVLLGVELGAVTTTGADGTFALDVPGTRARLELADEGRILVAAGSSTEIPGEVLLVAPSVRVAGTIVDASGVPVAGARLILQGVEAAIERLPFAFESTTWEFEEERSSDVQGRFDLGAVASYPGARLTAVVDTQYVADVELPSVDRSDVVLVATIRPQKPKPRVRGVVLDDRGAGIAGASVRMAGNAVVSDESGRFELVEESFDPESEIVAIKPGLAPGWVAGLGTELREKRLVENVEIRLIGPALSITGRAVDAEGRALEGWMVSLADTVKYPTMGIPLEFAAAGWYGDKEQPMTGDRGRFEVRGLAPIEYRIRLTDRDTGLTFDSGPIAAGARDVEIRVPADALRDEIRGRTVSTLGVPVEDVEIRVLYPIAEGRGFSRSGHAQSTQSDSDGSFEFEHVPRRGLKLGVSGKGIRGQNIAVPDDVDPNDVRITVTVERQFQIEVADAEQINQFEILDRAGRTLSIDGRFAHALSSRRRIDRDGERFPTCTVSEEGTTIVLYRKDQEVRRAPITWTGERIQVLRP